MAQKTGLATGTIQQYEYGNYKPKIEQLHKIATALDINISELTDDWNIFSDKDLTVSLTGFGGALLELHDKKSLQEKQEKYMDRLFHYQIEICRKMDLLNHAGQVKALEQIELLAKIPEYQKNK